MSPELTFGATVTLTGSLLITDRESVAEEGVRRMTASRSCWDGAVRRYDEEQFDLDRRQRALHGGAHCGQAATSSRAPARCAAVYEGHLNFVTDFEGWHSMH